MREVAHLPLAEDIPIAFNSCRKGPRGVCWRDDRPAELTWTEAQVSDPCCVLRVEKPCCVLAMGQVSASWPQQHLQGWGPQLGYSHTRVRVSCSKGLAMAG